MTSYSRTNPGERCYIVLVTDGRANVPLAEGSDPSEEVRRLAEGMTIPGVGWLVADAASGKLCFDHAARLA